MSVVDDLRAEVARLTAENDRLKHTNRTQYDNARDQHRALRGDKGRLIEALGQACEFIRLRGHPNLADRLLAGAASPVPETERPSQYEWPWCARCGATKRHHHSDDHEFERRGAVQVTTPAEPPEPEPTFEEWLIGRGAKFKYLHGWDIEQEREFQAGRAASPSEEGER